MILNANAEILKTTCMIVEQSNSNLHIDFHQSRFKHVKEIRPRCRVNPTVNFHIRKREVSGAEQISHLGSSFFDFHQRFYNLFDYLLLRKFLEYLRMQNQIQTDDENCLE